MSRYLCVGDIHLMDRPSVNVTDSYTDDMFALLDQTVQIAKDLKLDGVVWAGDVFHLKNPSRNSHSLVQRAIKVVQSYPCPLYIVVGNHDISNDRLESIADQPIGELFLAGAINLDGWAPKGWLFGVPWQQRWQEDGTPMEAFQHYREDLAGVNLSEHPLVVTHAPIYPPSMELEWEFVPTKGEHGISSAMGNTGALYYGHIHEPHGVFNVEGVRYCNFGALSRGSLTEYNRTREIAVTLYDTTTGEFEKIVLDYKPADEVFRLEAAAAVKEAEERTNTFLAGVGTARLEIVSIDTVLDHIKTLGLSDKIVRRAQELLEGAQ